MAAGMNFARKSVQRGKTRLGQKGLVWLMLGMGLPLFATLFTLFFLVLHTSVETVLHRSIARNAQLHAMAMGLGLEQILAEARNQLLILAEGSMRREDMVQRLGFRVQAAGLRYREVAFLPAETESRYLLLIHEGNVVQVPDRVASNALASPFHMGAPRPQDRQVSIGQPQEVVYSLLPIDGAPQSVTLHVIRLFTSVVDKEGNFCGLLCLSLDLRSLRDAMTLYSSPELPFSHGGSSLRSFFFDRDGWLLFQAEPSGASADIPLGSGMVRIGYSGDFGRPGFGQAFRPDSSHESYWRMVSEAQAGRSGQINLTGEEARQAESISFAPISFASGAHAPRSVIGGLAILDNSFAMGAATWQIRLMYTACCLVALALLGLGLWWVARHVRDALGQLECALAASNSADAAAPLELPPLLPEVERIRQTVDTLLGRLGRVRASRQSQEREEWEIWQREAAENLPSPESMPLRGLIGQSPPLRALLQQIERAAQVDADVLVVGETGTGKELVAESIHAQSVRASGPYISINCGALDETLLMDTLFGHVKGAFTEARQNRKGAFLTAEGGTLMLDEVGNASHKVQQALLRALSTRRIRPLGSDQDIAFNTRIIAATNADLLGEGTDGAFRDDLYYRLAVITIQTPPLRERKEDIPALVAHFMAVAFAGQQQPVPRVSRGALARLVAHDWPGNIRELKNTVTRALAFCDGRMIQAQDILLDAQASPAADVPPLPTEGPSASVKESEAALPALPDRATGGVMPTDVANVDDLRLNARQRAMWARLQALGGVTRQEYQNMVGSDISMRTAQYDLQQLVRCGLLRKEGRGPNQRYLVTGDGSADRDSR